MKRMRTAVGLMAVAVLLAGCGGGLLGQSTTPSGSDNSASAGSDNSSSLGDEISTFILTGGSSKPKQVPGGPAAPQNIICPEMTVRGGASTLTVNGPGQPSPLTLRYQGSIEHMARDCSIVDKNTMRMKIGVMGRIILGPEGGPGEVDIPLRFAVVQDGPNPVTVLTRSYVVPVTIGPDQGNVVFSKVDDDVTFPMVPARELKNYVVYVGFDVAALHKRPRRARRARRR